VLKHTCEIPVPLIWHNPSVRLRNYSRIKPFRTPQNWIWQGYISASNGTRWKQNLQHERRPYVSITLVIPTWFSNYSNV